MSSQPDFLISSEEYLTIERKADYKSEYIAGEMRAMAGGSERHNLIIANVIAGLHSQLIGRPCRVYPSDLKVRVPGLDSYFYPDVSVIYGEPQFHDEFEDVVLNPIVIIEVLSETTAAYDRGKKFQYYQQIDTLAGYLMIAQDEAVVEHYIRQDSSRWIYTKTSDMEAKIALPSIECELILSQIYDKTI